MAVNVSNYVQNQPASGSPVSSNTSTASVISGGQANLNTSYSDFLTLLTTQLKNQDPTSPMDPNQFTQQLVSMTGVQQQLLSNQLLQQLVNDAPGSGVGSAVNLIGKTVTAASADAPLSGGQASWTYNLPSPAESATVTVKNSAGTTVYSGTAPSYAKGANTFTWNGQTNSGTQLPDGGPYTLSVAASDTNGASETSTVSISGVATSVQEVGGQTMIGIGSAQAPISSITAVH